MARLEWSKVQRQELVLAAPRTPRRHEQVGCGAPRWVMRAKHGGDICTKCGEAIVQGQWIHWGPTEPAAHKHCKRNRLALIAARVAAQRSAQVIAARAAALRGE